jgi:hypothetical protein
MRRVVKYTWQDYKTNEDNLSEYKINPVVKTNQKYTNKWVICAVLLLFVLFYVLFVCKYVLCYCHRVTTQLQLTNIYHIDMFDEWTAQTSTLNY